jgi:AcrR family transcriptional regulator
MASTKSSPKTQRLAQAPQRRNGKLRVVAILKAATDVIAEKGYEAATMAEIAERSDTRIGSLYRFFPHKDALANAMITHYRESIDSAFDAIDARIGSLSIPDLTDALLAMLVTLRKDGAAALQLIEAHKGWSAKREEFRAAALKRIANSLMHFHPSLSIGLARDMAFVLLHNMKAMKAFSVIADKKVRSGAMKELYVMTELYLKDRLQKT